MPTIHPPALKPGDTIAIVAPARYLDRQRVEQATRRLEQMGFVIKVPEDIERQRGYLAGDDETRARELMAAFTDPQVKAIMPGTGGYGTTRLLDRLDYDAIRRNPKILHGYSDITGLHLAIQKKAGLITFHGPLVMFGLGNPQEYTGFSADYIWRALLLASYLDNNGTARPPGYEYILPKNVASIETIAPGKARGRLTGGNLSLISALMGTPYEIETQGRILFIEDVKEEPYRLDRYLSQLRLGGKLEQAAGVILGQFTDCVSAKGENSLTIAEIIDDYFKPLGVPVIANFPAGHSPVNATLPINGLIEIDANAGRVRLLENPVRLDTTFSILSQEAAHGMFHRTDNGQRSSKTVRETEAEDDRR